LKQAVGGSGTSTYGYDGDGGRVRQTANGGTPLFYVRSSVLGQVVMEVNSTQGVYRSYVYANGRVVAERSQDGNFYWLHSSHLGSARWLTDAFGNAVYRGEFDPYGQAVYEWGSTTLNSLKFTGYERDGATRLDYANARMYNSGRGRFMQADPMGLKASDLSRPTTLNQYSYVYNDPVNFIDPDGKRTICVYDEVAGPSYWRGSTYVQTTVLNETCYNSYGPNQYSRDAQNRSGGGTQLQAVPLPSRSELRKNLEALLETGNCVKFFGDLITKVAEITGNSSHSTSALGLFDKISDFKLREPTKTASGIPVGGSVSGSIGNGDAIIFITEKYGSPDSSRVRYIYTETLLHEMLHLAGRNGNYNDVQLAEAVVKLGGLSAEDNDYLKTLDITKNPGASAFLDYMLQKNCPGKEGKTL
jgi:RHS repeat-associated protein